MAAGKKTKKKRLDGFGIFKGARPFVREDILCDFRIEYLEGKKKVKK